MIRYDVQRDQKAQTELEQLLYFFWEMSENAALVERVKTAVITAIDSLKLMPARFASAGFADAAIRRMHLQRYPVVIYFKIMPNHTVIILHIAHARSNHQANFSHIYQ